MNEFGAHLMTVLGVTTLLILAVGTVVAMNDEPSPRDIRTNRWFWIMWGVIFGPFVARFWIEAILT